MLHVFTIRRLPSSIYAAVLALALAAFIGIPAHASVLSSTIDCSATGDGLKCHLLTLLDFLYAVAGVLGCILIVVVGVAIKYYCNCKRDTKANL